MTKKQKAKLVCERLAEIYPEAECALQFGGEPWRLLVMARLSAQCTDARVNAVSVPLFERYPTLCEMADADIVELEELVRPCGLYRTKAASIKSACADVRDRFGGVVPDNMDDLLSLAGVGRKIANLLLDKVWVDCQIRQFLNRHPAQDNITVILTLFLPP